MTWFKVDDNLAFHAKVVAAGNPALGLWVRAGSWSAQQLTDGFVPDHMLAALGTKQQAQRLVDVRLWERVEGGYTFHEWELRQPSRGDVEAERAAARDRMREMRAKKKGVTQTPKPQVSAPRAEDVRANTKRTSPEVRDLFGNPDPTRPDPTNKPSCASADAEREFAEFWSTYPKRKAKGDAVKAFKAARKKADLPTILAAVRRSIATDWVGKDPEFIPYPATWLRRESWADEATTAIPQQGQVRHLPHAVELETPPDGLSPAEYAAWERARRERRGA